MKILTTGIEERTSYPLGEHFLKEMHIIMPLIDLFKEIEEFKEKNINLYCAGSSGAIMATIFSMNVPNCKLIHIRKDGENSHQANNCHRPHSFDIVNVIIDDFIASGETVNRISSFVKTNSINCLIISGESLQGKLIFQPDYIICGEESESKLTF